MFRRRIFDCFSVATIIVNIDTEEKRWRKHAAFYQTYPRSFVDSDGNGIGDVKGEHSNQVSHCSIPVTRVFFQSLQNWIILRMQNSTLDGRASPQFETERVVNYFCQIQLEFDDLVVKVA
jgi:hypothetical protein